MRKTLPAVLLLLVTVPSVAQSQNRSKQEARDFFRIEVFGGYSFLSSDLGFPASNNNFNGWQASATGNLNRWFGLTADFSGHYNSTNFAPLPFTIHGHVNRYLFGPQFSYRNKKATLFAHALLGETHDWASATGAVSIVSRNHNALTFGTGAGVDWNLGRRIAWRVAEVDYLHDRYRDLRANNLRIATGIVFRF